MRRVLLGELPEATPTPPAPPCGPEYEVGPPQPVSGTVATAPSSVDEGTGLHFGRPYTALWGQELWGWDWVRTTSTSNNTDGS